MHCCCNAEDPDQNGIFDFETYLESSIVENFQVYLETVIVIINLECLLFLPASQLDDLILHVHNNTKCPCEPQICTRAPGGYRIAVALIGSIWLDPELRYRASSPVE